MELAPQCNRYFTFHQEDTSAAFLFIASILLIAAIQFAFDVFLKRNRFSEKQISFMRKIFIVFIALTFIISMEYLALYTSEKIINSEKTQR